GCLSPWVNFKQVLSAHDAHTRKRGTSCARLVEARTIPWLPMTLVEIRGDDFWIDGSPTYRGRTWRDLRIEGLLLNARMAQGRWQSAFMEIPSATFSSNSEG